MRGETQFLVDLSPASLFQSTLPMRGETLIFGYNMATIIISIHSPHAGRDILTIAHIAITGQFQSTLPMRGETKLIPALYNPRKISIHSPHAGRD